MRDCDCSLRANSALLKREGAAAQESPLDGAASAVAAFVAKTYAKSAETRGAMNSRNRSVRPARCVVLGQTA